MNPKSMGSFKNEDFTTWWNQKQFRWTFDHLLKLRSVLDATLGSSLKVNGVRIALAISRNWSLHLFTKLETRLKRVGSNSSPWWSWTFSSGNNWRPCLSFQAFQNLRTPIKLNLVGLVNLSFTSHPFVVPMIRIKLA